MPGSDILWIWAQLFHLHWRSGASPASPRSALPVGTDFHCESVRIVSHLHLQLPTYIRQLNRDLLQLLLVPRPLLGQQAGRGSQLLAPCEGRGLELLHAGQQIVTLLYVM